MAAVFGRRAMARAVAVASVALTVVDLASLLDSGGGAMFVLTAVGVASIGIAPAVVVLQSGRRIGVAGTARPGCRLRRDQNGTRRRRRRSAFTVRDGVPLVRPDGAGGADVLLWAWMTAVGAGEFRSGATFRGACASEGVVISAEAIPTGLQCPTVRDEAA